MRDARFEECLVCFYGICRITTFDSFFTAIAVFTASIKSVQCLLPSDILTAVIECEWHKAGTVFLRWWTEWGCRCLCKPQLDVSKLLWKTKRYKTLNVYCIAQKKKTIGDASKVSSIMGSLDGCLCVVCNRSEECIPLRNTPRLLQLMTAGGSSLRAVWQHLLRY